MSFFILYYYAVGAKYILPLVLYFVLTSAPARANILYCVILLRAYHKIVSRNTYRYHITRVNLITEDFFCKKCLNIFL